MCVCACVRTRIRTLELCSNLPGLPALEEYRGISARSPCPSFAWKNSVATHRPAGGSDDSFLMGHGGVGGVATTLH